MSEVKSTPRVQWTEEQWDAITMRGSDLLVAAAAGSGKTAVLVERIIRLITEGDDPCDVDRLLVATFTKAAADEMRGRIRDALEKKLDERPDDERLRRQLAFIHRASITTLHSFCMEVVQRHVQKIGLDPNFRIAGEAEADLIRRDVLEALFEEYYADSDPDSDFFRLVDAYSGDRSDEPLYSLVLDVYEFSRSHPEPQRWLIEQARAFESDAANENGAGSGPFRQWLDRLADDVAVELHGIAASLSEARHIATLPNGPAPYEDTISAELTALNDVIDAALLKDWTSLYDAAQRLTFGRLKPCRGDAVDKELQELAKQLRDQAKKQWTDLKEEVFGRHPHRFAEECRHIAPLMHMLVKLVMEFEQRFSLAKQSKGLLDFSDLEHYCLHILREPAESESMDASASSAAEFTRSSFRPSTVALDYQEQFEEVLIDEYQDTNLVQETILSLITRRNPGNRFMVGDVKQSIYRFRLAEPGLFLQKYNDYERAAKGTLNEGAQGSNGVRIDLARNFRSRKEVVDGVNYVFRQIMTPSVGEMAYDDQAKLILGAKFDDAPEMTPEDYAVEFVLIDRANHALQGGGSPAQDESAASTELQSIAETAGNAARSGEPTGPNDPVAEGSDEAVEADAAALEARYIAARIHQLMGADGKPMMITDKAAGLRPVTFRDIVILLRATTAWSPVIIEELRLAGIPAYAELSTGYFEAGEVELMMALLHLIDNPHQDIPLAAVLRSPLFRVTEEELALIRIASPHANFYEAVTAYAETTPSESEALRQKLASFLSKLALWREEARQCSVADLIWRIYRLTGYFDFVGSMPGGAQRQANLRALYDRARQFETTSFRGLFRFLRFIERMRERGNDLGAAGAIGEQENVVRIMSIHKSKGLEFPVVFVAGLAKKFNMQDMNGSFLLHKELGFGPKLVDTAKRVSFPTLPNIAIRKRLRLETLAEEMRILYVAMTRAREKLIMLGTAANVVELAEKWALSAKEGAEALPDALLARAQSYLDWLGPVVMRHPDTYVLRNIISASPETIRLSREDESRWLASTPPADMLVQAAAAREARDETVMEAIYRAEPVFHLYSDAVETIERQLEWNYAFSKAHHYFSKTSVSELKRREIEFTATADDEALPTVPLRSDNREGGMAFNRTLLRRPRFLQERTLSPAERGTLIHTIMQHLPLDTASTPEAVEAAIARLAEAGLVPQEYVLYVDPQPIAAFLGTELARRIRASSFVRKEVPFSYGLKASDVYPDADPVTGEETILVQGVVDCLFATEEGDGLVLLDYKTDVVRSEAHLDDIRARYELQISLYAKAIGEIWQRPVSEAYLYLFDGARILPMK